MQNQKTLSKNVFCDAPQSAMSEKGKATLFDVQIGQKPFGNA